MRNQLYILFFFLSFCVVDIHLNAQCLTDGHSNVWQDSWTSCSLSANPNSARAASHWIQYDFGEPYFLSTSHIWNANQLGETDRGFQNIVIDYSTDGVNWIEWGTHTLSQAPGTNGYQGETGPDFSGIKAQYLLITALDNFGDPSCASLAEVRAALKKIKNNA